MSEIYTAFHAIEERMKRGGGGLTLYVAKGGKRPERLLELAREKGIKVITSAANELDRLAGAQHRGVALEIRGGRKVGPAGVAPGRSEGRPAGREGKSGRDAPPGREFGPGRDGKAGRELSPGRDRSPRAPGSPPSRETRSSRRDEAPWEAAPLDAGPVVEPAEVAFEEWLGRLQADTPALVLVLDGVTDPQNLGAILRSADKFDVDLVITPNRRSAGTGPTVAAASAGALAWVPQAVVPNLARALKQLKEAGFWVYGADLGGIPASEAGLQGRVVLVMGAEGRGLGRLVSETCDRIITIPTGGHVDSLNVSVATGILLYEVRRHEPSRGG